MSELWTDKQACETRYGWTWTWLDKGNRRLSMSESTREEVQQVLDRTASQFTSQWSPMDTSIIREAAYRWVRESQITDEMIERAAPIVAKTSEWHAQGDWGAQGYEIKAWSREQAERVLRAALQGVSGANMNDADQMNLQMVMCGLISTIDFIPAERHPTACMPWVERIIRLFDEQWWADQNVVGEEET